MLLSTLLATRPMLPSSPIRRGTFTSVKDLIAAIGTLIDGWNERCHPFTWTKTVDDILTKARGSQRSSITRH